MPASKAEEVATQEAPHSTGVTVSKCCSASLPPDARDGLECNFGNLGAVPATYSEQDGAIYCVPPQAPEQQQTLRCRVQTKEGKVLHELDFQPDEGLTTRIADSADASSKGDEPAEAKSTTEMKQQKKRFLGPFAIISLSYVLFTTTDGAIRMIVLLHAYQQGFTALALAGIFSGYELAGVVVNLLAGVAGARWGIKATLLAGLCFQLASLGMLLGWQTSWDQARAIAYITVAQVLNGIAKDLTKLGGKTVTKLVTPDERQLRLFRLVALITGFKNSFKGLGYLLGAVLLTVNYYLSIGAMMVLIVPCIPFAALGLSWELGRSNKSAIKLTSVFKKNYNVNMLSAARFFLFGSRDLWFEVTLPFFLRSAASGIGWSRTLVGLYLAVWIILYGQVQSWSPKFVLKPLLQSPPNKWVAVLWAGILTACPAIMAAVLLGPNVYGTGANKTTAIVVITVVLYLFCLVFAVNSAVHSYLILRYSEGDKVAMNVGFYYMANAGGRLVGTLLSGILYTYAGDNIVTSFGWCFIASVAFAFLSSVLAIFINDHQSGLAFGPCLQIVAKATPTSLEQAEGQQKVTELAAKALQG